MIRYFYDKEVGGIIVDAGILVGEGKELNYASAGSRAVDGLWELYNNVVKPFIEGMMEEGVRYVEAKGSDYPGANTYWTARTGEIQTEGVSYCYGCKDRYDDFWKTVTRCQAPASVTSQYRGNVNDTDCSLTGEKDYPGLYLDEFKKLSPSNPQFNPFSYWAGIDCSGLVQRLVMAGKSNVISLVKIEEKIPDLKDADTDKNGLDDGALGAYQFYDSSRAHLIPNTDVEKIKRGDFVVYKSRRTNAINHISIVYCTRNDLPPEGAPMRDECRNLGKGEYMVIQAYGVDGYWTGKKPNRKFHFTRKVLITPYNIPGLPNPLGFGRIKVWN